MALDGWGCMRIAKQLMDDKIPITRVKSNTEWDVNYYSWGSARISHILRNPFYKGAHLVCRTHQKGIRSNTYDIIPREDWEVQSVRQRLQQSRKVPYCISDPLYCFVSCLVLKILMFYNLSLLFVFFLHYIRAKERHNGKCVN